MASFVVLLGPVGSSRDPLVAATDAGDLRGVETDDLRVWRGVRYAASPTGAGRWSAPGPAPTWGGVQDADAYGDDCLQPEPYTYGQRRLSVSPGSSEDCLFLNVVRPSRRWDDLPVMFCLRRRGQPRGAAFRDYGGGSLAERGDVVFTVNYRLGAARLAGPLGVGGEVRTSECGTRSPRSTGCTRTSPRSAAIPTRSRSPAARRVPCRSTP